MHDLAALPDPARAAVDVQGKMIAVGANLRQMDEAGAKLDPETRRQVTTAVEPFRSEATAITGTLLLSQRLSAKGGGAELSAALDRLDSTYDRTLARIACG